MKKYDVSLVVEAENELAALCEVVNVIARSLIVDDDSVSIHVVEVE